MNKKPISFGLVCTITDLWHKNHIHTFFITLFLYLNCFSSLSAQTTGQFKVRNDAFIQIGYSNYKVLTFGQETNSPNNGRFAIEYWAAQQGLNIWKPWPTSGAANYLLFIRDNGNIGIGNAATSGYRLDVSGALRCVGFANISDSRLKRNILPLSNTLADLQRIRIYEYYFKSELDEKPEGEEAINELKDKGTHNFGLDDNKHFGVIAQELETIYPNLVSKDDRGYYAVNYVEMVPILIKSIQELDEKVKILEAQLQVLKKD